MKKRPFVIGIAGATGSGKTWFANKLKEALSVSACIFAMDSYSKSAEFVNGLEYHYDNPKAIDFDKAFVDLNTIIQGGTVNFPIYDYKTHSVVSEIIISDPAVIIIEGLYAFYDKRFLDVMDFKIWIEADESLCLERRVKRDVAERGDPLDVATSRYLCDSRPAFSAFYVMNKKYADCIIPNANNDKIPQIIDLLTKYTQS